MANDFLFLSYFKVTWSCKVGVKHSFFIYHVIEKGWKGSAQAELTGSALSPARHLHTRWSCNSLVRGSQASGSVCLWEYQQTSLLTPRHRLCKQSMLGGENSVFHVSPSQGPQALVRKLLLVDSCPAHFCLSQIPSFSAPSCFYLSLNT